MTTPEGSPGVGAVIHTIDVCPSSTDLFLFSAVTWNPHRIHYDASYARDVEHHEGVVVAGPLMGAWMTRLIEEWAATRWDLRSISFRNRAVALVDTPLKVSATVVAAGDERLELTLATTAADGTVVCDGRAILTLR